MMRKLRRRSAPACQAHRCRRSRRCRLTKSVSSSPTFAVFVGEHVRAPPAPDRGPTGADPAPAPALTYERLRGAASEPHNWLTYWGDYQGTHYSGLKQITTANVRRLQAAWARQLPGSSVLEATPLVVDGIMYTSGPPGIVVALDAATGRQIWRYQRPQKVRNPNEINPFNRGVAVLGNRVFVGTLDAALVALDARTGALLWEVQMADPMQGFSITSPPLPVKDKIIAGIAGGEFGIRGFIDAYDPATGKRLWRFSTIPGPGEFGHDTWTGDSWKHGCGATWLPGSYDPDLDLAVLGGRQSVSALQRRRAARATTCSRSSVRRARSGDRHAQVALPVHAARHPRLGLEPGHDARRSCLPRPAAQAADARRSQRPLLRARSHERQVPRGDAVRARRPGTAASTRTAGRF